jgi:hypothetical protein
VIDSTPNPASPGEQAHGDAVFEGEPPEGGSVDPDGTYAAGNH